MQHGPLHEEDLRAVFKKVHGIDIERAEQEGINEMRRCLNPCSAIWAPYRSFGLRPDMSEANSPQIRRNGRRVPKKAEESQQAQGAYESASVQNPTAD